MLRSPQRTTRPMYYTSLARAWLMAGALGVAPAVSLWAQQGPVPVAPGSGELVANEGEVLTRGPVHEAFAEQFQLNPVPSIAIPKEPPAPIEEIPPDEKPEGDNVAWIPGYWAWDEERDDFLWISGVWRVVPEGMQWIPGYWAQSTEGYQWVPGAWTSAASAQAETVYYPAPPASLEVGPSSPAPNPNYAWAPGYWSWTSGRYAWRPGYWYQPRQGVMWIPPRYLWTPSGYMYANGYYDYEFARRGLLFAPVYFPRGVYNRPGFSYGPRVWINVAGFSLSLFARPTHRHYYFGDYYANNYRQSGYQPWYAWGNYRGGYDPTYAYYRRQHRDDADWDRNLRQEYDRRRDNPDARPPRTWQAMVAAEAKQPRGPGNGGPGNVRLAATLADYATVQAAVQNPLRLEKVDNDRRDRDRQSTTQLNEFRKQRVRLEKDGLANATKAGGKADAGIKIALPKSPVAAPVVARQDDVDVRTKGGVDRPMGDNPKGDRPKGDEPKGDRPKADLPKGDRPKGDEPKVDRPKTELPKVDRPKGDEPKVDRPKTELPKVDRPKLDPPKADRPKAELPKSDLPKVAPPKVETPKVAPPKVEVPKVAPPKLEPPKAAPPKVEPPKVNPPKVNPKPEAPKAVPLPEARPPKSNPVPLPEVKPKGRPVPMPEVPKVRPPQPKNVQPPKVEAPKIQAPKPERPQPQPKAEKPEGDKGGGKPDKKKKD